jgi:hypothetical protein
MLGDRFDVVPSGQAADLTVHVTVTHVTVINPAVAGASKVASIVPRIIDTPFDHKLSIPSMQRLQSALGGKPKNAACDAFGRTGIPALLSGQLLGAPPECHRCRRLWPSSPRTSVAWLFDARRSARLR